MNVVGHIYCLVADKVVAEDEQSESGRKAIVGLKHNDIDCMRYQVAKFSKPGQKVLDRFAGALSFVKAHLLIGKHSSFFGWENDAQGLVKWMPNFVREYVSQMFDKGSDSTDDRRLTEAARVYSGANKSI